jgi:twinkle protein
MGVFLRHEPCPACGSPGGGSRYDNGSLHCFSCGYNEGDGEIEEIEETQVRDWEPLQGEAQALPKRGLSKETCAQWRYECGEGCQIANYYDRSKLVAQKIRKAGKKFEIRGDGKNMPKIERQLADQFARA